MRLVIGLVKLSINKNVVLPSCRHALRLLLLSECRLCNMWYVLDMSDVGLSVAGLALCCCSVVEDISNVGKSVHSRWGYVGCRNAACCAIRVSPS